MENSQVFWSKSFGRNKAKQGSNVNLITREYTDALGNVLRRLLEKDNEILFCGNQNHYNAYIRKAVKFAKIDINQERQHECQTEDIDQNPLPYIDMMGRSWINEVPMSDLNRFIVKGYVKGFTMTAIGKAHGISQVAISKRLKNITSVLSNHYPDLDLTSLPCSFGSYTEQARYSIRFKNNFVDWPVSKEKGYKIGKTANEHKQQTQKDVCMNLLAMDHLSIDNDYALCDGVPLGPTLLKEVPEQEVMECHIIAERMATRDSANHVNVPWSTHKPDMINPVTINKDGLSFIRSAVYGVNQTTTA